MTVGVVIPLYNCEAFVEQAIRSACAQGPVVSTIVVVDDGSSDASAAAAEAVAAEDARVSVLRQPNHGAAHARNRGYAALGSEPDLVLFLDADDVLAAGMAAQLERCLAAHPAAGLAFCRLALIDEAGRPLSAATAWSPRLRPGRMVVRRIPDSDPITPFFSILTRAPVIPSVSVLRRSTFEQTGGWDETFGQPFEDMNLFLAMSLLADVVHVPRALTLHRRRTDQSTSDAWRTASQERKLHETWLHRAAEDGRVREAFRAYDRQFIPYLGLRSALADVRRRRMLRAARFAGGALRAALGGGRTT